MKTSWRLFLLSLSCGHLLAAAPIQEVRDAIDKLRAAPNYSWKTTTATTNMPQQTMAMVITVPSQGKTLADGTTLITLRALPAFAPACEILVRGSQGAVRNLSLNPPAWVSFTDLERGDPGNVLGDLLGGAQPIGVRLDQSQLRSRLLLAAVNFKSPTFLSSDLVAKLRQLKLERGSYTGELPETIVLQWIAASGYFSGYESTLTPLKGTGAIWVTKGVLSKYEFTLSGNAPTLSNTGFTIKRTTEILEVGTTKIEVPREAF